MTPNDFDLLIHRYFEGSLSEDEESRFWEHLKADPAAADRFVEMSELESAVVESMAADDDMPSGVYAAVHGFRRRPRFAMPERPRPVWPYWVAAGLFIAALSMLLWKDEARIAPDPVPVARERGVPEPPRPTVPRDTLEAQKVVHQKVLLELDRKEEDLAVARREAEAGKQDQAQLDLEKSLQELQVRRREEAGKLAKVEEDLARPEPTRASPPAPAPGPVLDAVEGDVAWIGTPGPAPQPGQPVPAGAGFSTTGPKARLAIKLPDETRLELQGDGRIEDIQGHGDQKRFTVPKGTLLASVAKQTGARSLVIITPHAELTVLGTRFVVQVAAEETRLDVEEGKVRNRRLSDRRVVDVAAGHTLSTGKSGPLTPKPLPLVRSFQDGVLPTPDYAGTQDTSIGSASTAPAGSQDLLRVYKESGRVVENTTLLRWDISSIPPRSRVVAAELSFWVTGAMGGPGARAVELRRRWEEGEATWKLSRAGVPWQVPGARGDADAGTRVLAPIAPAAPGWSTFPLTDAGVALVQQWVSAPAANFGLAVTKEPPNAWDLASREWATAEHRPKLTVRYIPPAK